MNEKFTSLDSIVEDIKAECATRVAEAETRMATAEIEARICREALARAQDEKAYAEGVAHRLIENFNIAEKALARAKEFALQIPEPVKTEVPANAFNTEISKMEAAMEHELNADT